jgi:hypothetical protein
MVLLWDQENMKVIRQVGAIDRYGDVTVTGDGNYLFAFDQNNDMHVWDLETYKRKEYIHFYELDDVGRIYSIQLESLSDTSILQVLEFYNKTLVYQWETLGDGVSYGLLYELDSMHFSLPVVFSPDRSLFATNRGHIYETATGELFVQLPTSGFPAWTDDGKYLLFVNNSVEYWSVDGR